MSANSLLDANTGQIQSRFLPTGSSNTYVDNPMQETLNGNGYNMQNVGIITCSATNTANVNILDSLATIQGTINYGTSGPGLNKIQLTGPNSSLYVSNSVIAGTEMTAPSITCGQLNYTTLYPAIPPGGVAAVVAGSNITITGSGTTPQVNLATLTAPINAGGQNITNANQITCSQLNYTTLNPAIPIGVASVSAGTNINVSGPVSNPIINLATLTSALNAGGQDITNVDEITCNKLNYTTLNPAIAPGGVVSVVAGTNITITGSTATPQVNLAITSAVNGGNQNITNVNNIEANGTIVPNQWNSFPQQPQGTTLSWNNPPTTFVIYSASLTVGTYIINLDFEWTALGFPTGTPVTLEYTTGLTTKTLLITTDSVLEDEGYTGSFLFYTPVNVSFEIEVAGGNLAIAPYTITTGSQGHIKLT
jgi:hypothetical protein